MGVIRNIFNGKVVTGKNDNLEIRKDDEHTTINKALNEMTVLLCEDHPINIEIAKNMLDDIGMTYDVAENGQVGVDLFRSSTEGYYDVILMDIVMPVMNGMDATKCIRKLERNDSKVPVIAMTANTFGDEVYKMYEDGITDILEKPFDIDELKEVINKIRG